MDWSRTAIVTVIVGTPERELTDKTIIGLEQGMFEDTSMKKVSSAKVTIQGRLAYRYLGHSSSGSWMGGVVTIKDGVTYNVEAVKRGGDPFLDPELARYMDSYRLP